jgi:hypothetical protein
MFNQEPFFEIETHLLDYESELPVRFVEFLNYVKLHAIYSPYRIIKRYSMTLL